MAGQLTETALRSAWPSPSINRLIRAVALHDEKQASAAWEEFESEADFDNLTQGEFRLIGLAAKRLVSLAPQSRKRPVIAGIERAIWSRSQLAIREAASGLRKLGAASIDILLIKGASRAASGRDGARGRIVNDIDIVVRPENFIRGFDILAGDGWTPASSGSVLYNRSRLSRIVSINLVRGEFGNIDLHRTPFKFPFDSGPDDLAVWQRSVAGRLGYENVVIPSDTDAVTIAIAHGSLDAHKNSDWLADIAAAIDKGIDWELFLEITQQRRLQTAAAIALGYVRERLERPVPAKIMSELENAAAGNPVRLLSTVAQARPKANRFDIFWLARAVSKQSRLFRTRRRPGRQRKITLASPFHRPAGQLPDGAFSLETPLPLPDCTRRKVWKGVMIIDIMVDLPPAARRVEFEINTRHRHLARLRAFVRNRGHRRLPLRFRAKLSLSPEDHEIFMQAVPARSFNDKVPEEELDRYRATPFGLLNLATHQSR